MEKEEINFIAQLLSKMKEAVDDVLEWEAFLPEKKERINRGN